MPVYHKLVRDRIPEVIEHEGKRYEVRVLEEAEYVKQLQQKLQEELAEYLQDGSLEELADIAEVMRALVKAQGATLEQFEAVRAKKQAERGGFERRLFLVQVED